MWNWWWALLDVRMGGRSGVKSWRDERQTAVRIYSMKFLYKPTIHVFLCSTLHICLQNCTYFSSGNTSRALSGWHRLWQCCQTALQKRQHTIPSIPPPRPEFLSRNWFTPLTGHTSCQAESVTKALQYLLLSTQTYEQLVLNDNNKRLWYDAMHQIAIYAWM